MEYHNYNFESDIKRECKHCGQNFYIAAPNQKYCNDPGCLWERWVKGMSRKKYIEYTNGECDNYD